MANLFSEPGFSGELLPRSQDELDELDRFLMSDQTSDETMVLEILDGYLTALAIGPVTVMPSVWLPRVWGPTEEDAPEFETTEQAQRILGLIFRHMNDVIHSLEDDVESHDIVIGSRKDPVTRCEYPDGEMWAYGFMQGVALCQRDWEPAFNDPAASQALRPIRLLDGQDVTEEERLVIRTVPQRAVLSEQLQDSLAVLYRFWLPYRRAMHEQATVRRAAPKVGRNDPCPCGSGKKFKHRCGATRH
jgi:uncharacterized protein